MGFSESSTYFEDIAGHGDIFRIVHVNVWRLNGIAAIKRNHFIFWHQIHRFATFARERCNYCPFWRSFVCIEIVFGKFQNVVVNVIADSFTFAFRLIGLLHLLQFLFDAMLSSFGSFSAIVIDRSIVYRTRIRSPRTGATVFRWRRRWYVHAVALRTICSDRLNGRTLRTAMKSTLNFSSILLSLIDINKFYAPLTVAYVRAPMAVLATPERLAAHVEEWLPRKLVPRVSIVACGEGSDEVAVAEAVLAAAAAALCE